MNKNIRFTDLFCGIGGIRLGMEKQGFECVFSCDINPECQKLILKISTICQRAIYTSLMKLKYQNMTFFVPVFPASHSVFQENKKDSMIQEARCFLKSAE